MPKTGRLLIGMVAGFKSEWWPVFDRNGGRLHVGIRIQSKLRDVEDSVHAILRLRAEGRQDHIARLCRARARTGGWLSEPEDGGRGAAFGVCRPATRDQAFEEQVRALVRRDQGPAVDVEKA